MKSTLQTSERLSLLAVPDDGESLSALTDGHLAAETLGELLATCRDDAALTQRWASYQLIGDVLRAPGAPVRVADAAFVSRLSARLAQEHLAEVPVAASTLRPGAAVAPAAQPAALLIHRGAAANDGAFRWKLAAGFASLAAVSAIAWNSYGLLAPVADAPKLAQSSTSQPILVASPQGTMVRDARLEELLAAHRQLSGASALEAPSGFLRNAAFEPSQNAGR